jgi:RNA recognition motif-containing protein
MSKNIYVGNLPFSTTADDLRAAFEKFGTVTSAEVISDRDTGRSRGFGFVEMADAAQADAAIAGLSGADMGGRALTVNEAKPREERPRRDGGGGGYGGGGTATRRFSSRHTPCAEARGRHTECACYNRSNSSHDLGPDRSRPIRIAALPIARDDRVHSSPKCKF